MASRRSAIPLPGLVAEVDNLSLQDSFKYLRNHREGRLNIVAIGKTGDGKSSTLNTLINYASDPKPEYFKEEESPYSVTKMYNQCVIDLFGLNIRVIDTIGLFDTEMTPERKAELQFLKIPDLEEEHKAVLANLAEVISLCSDGIDAFLLVVDGTKRVTFETKETINVIQRFLGISMFDHCIFVLTKADLAQDGTMVKMEEAINNYLKGLNYTDMGDRFVTFDNKRRPKHQVVDLLKAIEKNLQQRNGYPYNHVAFQYAQEALRQEKAELRAALENELQLRIEEVTNRIRADYEARLQVIQRQLDEKTEAINKLSQEASAERSRLQGDINRLQNDMVALDKRKDKELDIAVKSATNRVTEEYLHKFRGMEDQFQQQNALLQQSNETVQALRQQVTNLANRPPTVIRKGGCFDGLSQVDTPFGKKFMHELKIGDLVLSISEDGQSQYVPLLMWIQADRDDSMEFLEISTKDGRKLTISKNHKLFKFLSKSSKGRVDVDADEIVVGDLLCKSVDGLVEPVKVTKIASRIKLGIFAPFTSSGTIVVNGMLCSCYVRISAGLVTYSHNTAHLLCSPMRWLFSLSVENPVAQFLSKGYILGLISLNRVLHKGVEIKAKYIR